MLTIFEYATSRDDDLFRIPAISTREAYEWAQNHLMIDEGVSFAAFRRRLKRGLDYADAGEFCDRYALRENHLVNDASWDGCLFETYGAEEEFVYAMPAERVWTVLDVDDLMWVAAGRHFVNRMGYLISSLPWKSADEEYLCG